ncbi:leucyl aminopeptidase [Frankia sp. AgB32]|uniref:leucyl aminopeptidase n=1 Tax=Frankia sp. AgB32 TaxID=631119 RepID=UPI00200F4FAB|nr:leucyl aminopeptidase [Frankia sp. AgB32]MCK9893731.1 leucyl aminopeptidase [Frankia sp. AgB32]
MTAGGSAPAPAFDDLIGVPPDVILRSGPVGDAAAPVVAVVLAVGDDGPVFDEIARQVGLDLGVPLDRLVETEALRGDAGSVLSVPLGGAEGAVQRLLVVGVGAGRPADWRSAGAALARRGGSASRVALVASPPAEGLRALAEGIALGSYRVRGLLDRAGQAGVPAAAPGGRDDLNVNEVAVDEPGLDVDTVADGSTGVEAAGDQAAGDQTAGADGLAREVVVVTDLAADADARAAVRAARAVGTAVYIARDLVNTPSLVKSPEWLADRAVRIATAAGLTATVLGPRELAEQGCGGLTAVGQGSPRPPRLVRIEYHGTGANGTGANGVEEHRVLVGKGITFDSGGLSLKPPVSMIGMKTDMAGAAAVLGTMTALSALGVPGRVTGLLCLAENMIGAAAMRPGDVITCWGGTTVEVLNTDAEGRLVLADGLAYAAGELGADVIVDLATLTGAIAVALGRRTAGLFSSDDDLAEALAAAAGAAGEQVWRLPLTEDYRPALDSPVADLANIGRALDVGGGSITAALFLREFAGGRPWAHLDIAGTARADSDDGEISRGGTGWGVRTLLSWLSPQAAAAEPSPIPAG